MVKRVNIVLDDKVHEELKRIKDKLGYSWEKLLIEGAKCLAEKLKK